MNFAFCLFKYFPYGGLQRDFLKIAMTCQNRGHVVRTYTLSWNGEIPAGMEVVVVPVKALTNHILYEKYYDWVQRDLEKHPVDLVIGFNKMPGLDVYYAADSCYEEKARSQRSWLYRQLPRYRHFSRFEKAVFGRDSNTGIMMISEVQLPCFEQHYGTQRERMVFLPPGISRDRVIPHDWKDVRRSLRVEFNVGEDEKLILMVGSGFIKKGVKRAIYAVRSLPFELRNKTRMFVVGEDNPGPFERLIRLLGLGGQIKILNGRDDIPRFMQGADLLLHPATDENAGIVLIESLVAGLPVIVTDNCGYAHYVVEAEMGGLVRSPFSQKELNRMLLEFLTAENEIDWREKGARFARNANVYSLSMEAASYIETCCKKKEHFMGDRGSLAFTLFKYFPYGGLQRDFLRIAEECIQRGYRVRVYTLSWQGAVPDQIEVVLVPAVALTNHRRYQIFHDWVKNDIRKKPVRALIGFNKMPDLDIYYAADSCYEEKARNQRNWFYKYLPRYRFFSSFEKAVFGENSATKILMISQVQKPLFQKYYGTSENRIHVLPPGIDKQRILSGKERAEPCSVREEFNVDKEDYLLLMIGSGFVTKGLDRALRAIASLSKELREKCRLIVIGKDNPTPFERLAARLGLKDNIRILGGRDDVSRFLYAADLLIHPAYMENTGTVLLEAIVAGLPVLATDVCGYAHYVEDAGAGKLVKSPFRQENLNRLLEEMLISEEKSQWSRNGLAYSKYADIYSMPQRAAEYIDETIR